MNVSEAGSDSMSESSLPQTYQLKTMCLAKKIAQMPSKEEHEFFLFRGLGEKMEPKDFNQSTFKNSLKLFVNFQ